MSIDDDDDDGFRDAFMKCYPGEPMEREFKPTHLHLETGWLVMPDIRDPEGWVSPHPFRVATAEGDGFFVSREDIVRLKVEDFDIRPTHSYYPHHDGDDMVLGDPAQVELLRRFGSRVAIRDTYGSAQIVDRTELRRIGSSWTADEEPPVGDLVEITLYQRAFEISAIEDHLWDQFGVDLDACDFSLPLVLTMRLDQFARFIIAYPDLPKQYQTPLRLLAAGEPGNRIDLSTKGLKE